MAKCKDCADWSQATEGERSSTELWLAQRRDEDIAGMGRCLSDSELMTARYDGGYTGELLTHADFGCNQFRAT